MLRFFWGVACCLAPLSADCLTVKGHELFGREMKSFIVSYMLVNHSRIINELHHGQEGVYLSSLLAQLEELHHEESLEIIERNKDRSALKRELKAKAEELENYELATWVVR